MSALRRRLRAEDGFTLIEVLAASVVLVIGLFAVLSTFDFARTQTGGSERSAQAIRIGEQELERILSVPYGALAETNVAAPSTCGQRGGIAASYAPGAVVATADAPATPKVTPARTWSATRMGTTTSVRGCLYDFVRWVDDPRCSATACPGTQDYKRVTVAVTVTSSTGSALPGGPQKPVLVSAVKANPRVGPGNTSGSAPPLMGGS